DCPVCGLWNAEMISYNCLLIDGDYSNQQRGSRNWPMSMEVYENRILPYIKEKTLLDIGCGNGYFVNCLNERGWEAEGYDPTVEKYSGLGRLN
ncbi:methyltransferase domain-containing protein, partial [Staphylococcus aureus]|uniref:methyltransferase domain-containing protein n=1 Tax=Staphylococcus aureus TaxID=1280 RepID=UPI0039BEA81A